MNRITEICESISKEPNTDIIIGVPEREKKSEKILRQ